MTNLEDVLEEFAMESNSPSAELLEQFVREHPQYARELGEFAVAIALEPECDVAPVDSASPDVERAVRRLHQRLAELKKQEPPPEGGGSCASS